MLFSSPCCFSPRNTLFKFHPPICSSSSFHSQPCQEMACCFKNGFPWARDLSSFSAASPHGFPPTATLPIYGMPGRSYSYSHTIGQFRTFLRVWHRHTSILPFKKCMKIVYFKHRYFIYSSPCPNKTIIFRGPFSYVFTCLHRYFCHAYVFP